MRQSAQAGETISVGLNQYDEFYGVLTGTLREDTNGKTLTFEYGSVSVETAPGKRVESHIDNLYVVSDGPKKEQDSHINAYAEIFDLANEAFKFYEK